jgi:hypothetical protein
MEPEPASKYALTIAAKQNAMELKRPVEGLLHRLRIPFELRGTSDDELSFEVLLPARRSTEVVTRAIVALNPKAATEVKWDKKKDK